jgi:hypothetical protein
MVAVSGIRRRSFARIAVHLVADAGMAGSLPRGSYSFSADAIGFQCFQGNRKKGSFGATDFGASLP